GAQNWGCPGTHRRGWRARGVYFPSTAWRPPPAPPPPRTDEPPSPTGRGVLTPYFSARHSSFSLFSTPLRFSGGIKSSCINTMMRNFLFGLRLITQFYDSRYGSHS